MHDENTLASYNRIMEAMIKLDKIRLQRGRKVLLEQADAMLYNGQKIALIGSNGSGKSSLFQLLLNELQADEGNLSIPQGWRIAHMVQEVEVSTRLALDYVIDGDQQLRGMVLNCIANFSGGEKAEPHQQCN